MGGGLWGGGVYGQIEGRLDRNELKHQAQTMKEMFIIMIRTLAGGRSHLRDGDGRSSPSLSLSLSLSPSLCLSPSPPVPQGLSLSLSSRHTHIPHPNIILFCKDTHPHKLEERSMCLCVNLNGQLVSTRVYLTMYCI